MDRQRGEDTPGDRVSRCMTWLEEHPDASLRDRACFAVVVAAGGDESQQPSFGEVARVLDVEVGEVFDALMSLMDK